MVLYQFNIEGYEWILGLSLMFALALIFSYLTNKDLNSFLIWLTIFNGFMVWGGLLPLWTLILCVIILVIVIYVQIHESKGRGL